MSELEPNKTHPTIARSLEVQSRLQSIVRSSQDPKWVDYLADVGDFLSQPEMSDAYEKLAEIELALDAAEKADEAQPTDNED